jgi:Na+:H+ antiporter
VLALEAPHGAAFDFLILFVVVLVGPALVERARVPGIIGLLVGGWAIGPHGLGLVGEGNQTISALGQLGLLYLMFVAGLELDLGMLRLHRRVAVGFGIFTFLAPFILGVGVGAVLSFSLSASLLLGSLLASHTLIVYPLIRQAGLGSNRAVASAVGATVLTDTLALIVLAGVAGTETGSGSTVEIFGELAAGLLVIVGGSLFGLPALARLVFRYVGSSRSVRFLVALISFLLMGTVAEVFGIEGIVGAFFAGLAMNPLVPNEGQTMHRLEFFGSAVFVPIFLVATGLLLDPSVMFELETLGYAGLFIIGCIGGKVIAAAAAMPAFGVTRSEAGVMFVLTTPQAAATLAATVVGFEIGLFSTVVVNAVLVLIFVSIVLSSVLAPRFARSVERTSEEARNVGERVLVAVADVPHERMLIELASRIARRSSGVIDWLLVRPPTREVDRAAVHTLEAIAEREGFDGSVHCVVEPMPAHAVVHAAIAHDASLVIVDGSVALDAGHFGRGHWVDALASSLPTPLVLVAGVAGSIQRVFTYVAESADGDPAAVAFVNELAAAVGGPAVSELSGPGWEAALQPGDLVFVALESWELAEGLPAPPAGTAIAAVPAPSISGRPVPSVLSPGAVDAAEASHAGPEPVPPSS